MDCGSTSDLKEKTSDGYILFTIQYYLIFMKRSIWMSGGYIVDP